MFGLGAFMLCSAQNVNTVMVGRFIVGWAVAVSGIADVRMSAFAFSCYEVHGLILLFSLCEGGILA